MKLLREKMEELTVEVEKLTEDTGDPQLKNIEKLDTKKLLELLTNEQND
jgi:hypothetical protein